jgi:glycosyltransferase involved in cell wall biosynthesis
VGGQLLVNLAILSNKPTGLTTYALNLFPQLRSLNPTLLTAAELPAAACHPIPAHMTSDEGSRGHVRRLAWTQFRLPQIYHALKANLLFSPVPEAPLFAGCRSVVMVHDLIPLRFPKASSPLTNYARFYVPHVLKQAQHIICNSQATAQDITHFYGIASPKITPIPLAYDAANFRDLDLPTRNYFLYLGRLDPYKNVQRLIAAFAQLPNLRDYELWIAGPADRRFTPSLTTQIQALQLTAQVKFLDYVPYAELPRLINQAIALVFPSLCEGFGLPALEAMACGTPVIASNLSALPEVVGDAAILIDPYSVSAIAAAMHTIATDSVLRTQLRLASLQRVSQFSWAKTGQATIEVLQNWL